MLPERETYRVEIEGVEGVGSVRLVGGQDREIRVWLRVDDLRSFGIPAEDIIDTLRKENIEFPGSTVVHFCNVAIAQEILERAPDFLIHMPCVAVVYEHEGRVFAEARLVPEDERLGELVVEVNRLLRSIIDYAIEE